MPDPNHLREVATRIFAMASQANDQETAEQLACRACDYLDQAIELERSKRKPRDIKPA
jgi:uncharacterized protein YwlG (UPF0340 family)